MYPKNNLYKIYLKKITEKEYSSDIPDITKKITLEHMNLAINCCDAWEYFMDIGAGSGHYSAPLLKKFKQGIIVEVEKFEEHEVLRKKHSNLNILNKTIEEIQISEKIDFISMIDLFEHLPNPKQVIEKVSQIQNKGGVVFIIMPNPFVCGPAPESELYFEKMKYGHHKHYLDFEINKIFESFGYQNVFITQEETVVREKVKRILRGISRRIKKVEENIFYKILRPLFIPLINVVLKFYESKVYKSEKNGDLINSKSRVIIYKKYE